MPIPFTVESHFEEIAKAYSRGETVAAIAKRLGFSHTGVTDCLQRHGCYPSRVRWFNRRVAAYRMFREGKRPTEIATLLHASRNAVYKWIRLEASQPTPSVMKVR